MKNLDGFEKILQLILAVFIAIGYWYLVHTKQASAEGFALLAGNIIQHIYHMAPTNGKSTETQPPTNGGTK